MISGEEFRRLADQLEACPREECYSFRETEAVQVRQVIAPLDEQIAAALRAAAAFIDRSPA